MPLLRCVVRPQRESIAAFNGATLQGLFHVEDVVVLFEVE